MISPRKAFCYYFGENMLLCVIKLFSGPHCPHMTSHDVKVRYDVMTEGLDLIYLYISFEKVNIFQEEEGNIKKFRHATT